MVIVGVDEVGRGCWAGPLVAAAVILPPGWPIEDGTIKLRDSKVMTKRQRNLASDYVENRALAIGTGWVWPQAIDSGGITQAVKSAMQQAIQAITIGYDKVIIDGNINYFADKNDSIGPSYKAVIKADGTVPCVSAASIVAKVARDKYMVEIANKYPGYGFEDHVGYGTAAHIAALNSLGVSDIHRTSFKPIKNLLNLGQ